MTVSGAFVRGVVLGTVAGAVYLASRKSTSEPPRLLQWDRVRKIAERLSRRDAESSVGVDPAVAERYRAMVQQSEKVIGDYLQQQLPLPLERVEMFDRIQWIAANIASFEQMFEPLELLNQNAMAGAAFGTRMFGELNQTVLSGQLGLLIGYLARRVLGQYDTAIFGREPVTTGRLYFVEPNIAASQERFHLEGDQFRMWIALHETTHAFEFEAHPWLRDYMNALLRQYFDTVGQDFGQLAFGTGGVLGLAQRVAQNANHSKSAIELFMTAEQQGIFQKLQALMCLLEGFSNHVMDTVGEQLLTTYPIMKIRFEARHQERPIVEQLFTRLTGLDMKFEQYQLGEKFVNAEVAAIGIQRFNRVWDGPDNLPTLAEIYEPERWRDRLGVA